MVAEQPRSLQTSVRMASAASAGANPAVDTAMLQQWVQNVDANMVVIDGRLDALDYATVEMRGQVADINANLHITIEQAKGALNGIVDGVRVELVGVHRQFHLENKEKIEQLTFLANSTKAKFIEMEQAHRQAGHTIAVFEARLAVMEAAAARAPFMGGTPTDTPPPSPRTTYGAAPTGGRSAAFVPHDPFGGRDPWAAYGAVPTGGLAAAAAAAAAAQGPQGRGYVAQPSGFSPAAQAAQPQVYGMANQQRPPMASIHRDFRVDNRGWNNHKALDLVTQPDAYGVWHDRALGHLCGGRPDVRKLLLWAEKQTEATLEEDIHAEAMKLGVHDYEMVDCVLFEAVKHIIAVSLLTRARACDGRGTELCRRLHCEWQGSAPQLKHAKARKYQEPARCATVAGLWEALPEWERLGEEVRAAGLEMPEWMRRAALEKLVPTEMLTTLISRPELDTYSTRVHWVKAQMEHQRGSSQARAVTGHAAGRRDPGGDVVMQAVVAEESWSLQEQLESLSGAIQALAKGKGKGKDHGKGKGRGPHTGAAPGGAGGGKSAGKGRTGHFDGTCNHCGKYGHRKFECRTLDKEMADMKVKAGIGRGAPLAPGTLNEVGATDDGTWQWADDTAQELQDSTGAEWSLGIGAVRKDVPPQPQPRDRSSHPEVNPWAIAYGSRNNAKVAQRTFGDFLAAAAAKQAALGKVHILGRNPFGVLEDSADEVKDVAAVEPCSCVPGCRNPPTAAPERHFMGTICKDVHAPQGPAVQAVGKPGRMVVMAAVDSGAEESVCPRGVFMEPMVPSAMSQAGLGYRAANGSPIKNYGQQKIQFATSEGHKCNIPFQAADVERPLISTYSLAQAGNVVEFSEAGGSILHVKTGQRIALVRKGAMYFLPMYVDAVQAPGFPRQAA